MKTINEIAGRLGIIPRLSLGIKLEGGGVKSTGPHLVTIVGAKEVTGKDWKTGKDRPEIRLSLLEKGSKYHYFFPVKSDKGVPHYLIEKLMDLKDGAQVILEMKNRGAKTFIDVRAPGEVERI